jgi:hypothetical protein
MRKETNLTTYSNGRFLFADSVQSIRPLNQSPGDMIAPIAHYPISSIQRDCANQVFGKQRGELHCPRDLHSKMKELSATLRADVLCTSVPLVGPVDARGKSPLRSSTTPRLPRYLASCDANRE